MLTGLADTLKLAIVGWMNTLLDRLFSLVTLCPCVLQFQLRVSPYGKYILLSYQPVSETPQLRSCWPNLNVEAASIS